MAAKLIKCKHCEKEVAKGVKKCPHCGGKLKMGMMMKLIIGGVSLAILAAIFGPSMQEKKAALSDKLSAMESASASDLKPTGELAELFSLGSKGTDIQRDNKKKEIFGKIVQWRLPVYEVKKMSDEKGNRYKIQTSGGNMVGSFVNIWARSDEEVRHIEALKTKDYIHFKGRIDDTTMRNLDINDAILIR